MSAMLSQRRGAVVVAKAKGWLQFALG